MTPSSGPEAPQPGPDLPAAQPESIWALKPWWCQPWSILLTGVGVVLLSWWGLGRWWISLPLALAVLAWWGLFLVLVPAAWRQDQLAARQAPAPHPPG